MSTVGMADSKYIKLIDTISIKHTTDVANYEYP